MPAEERRNLSALYNPFTIEQLQLTYPYINWLEFINWNLHNILQVDQNEVVVVLDMGYILKLEKILQSTPKRTIANYFAWRSVLFSSDLLNTILRQQEEQYLAKTTGMLKADSREAKCIKKTMS